MAVAKQNAAQQTGLDADLLRGMYRHMVRSRILDERMWVLNRQGRAPFWISGMGHEAVQVGVTAALRPGVDWIAPYYRDLAMTMVLGMTPRDHLLSVLARAADPNSGGRQMPAHYGCAKYRIVTGGSAVATQLLHAAGIALASKMRGEDAVTVTSLGEGATSEGDFHEALNFAATHRLPFICLVENNGYAISVPWQKQMPTEDVADRASAYGIPGVKLDGGDAIASYRAAKQAVARARAGEGPTLIEAKVVRLTSHSSDDDQRRYRTPESIEADRKTDCVLRFRATLEQSGVLSPGDAEEIRAALVRELDQATQEAEAAPLPEPESALLHVTAED
ncbi:MAG: thiamine pyrophosphate-dependent dehydrogenase E1 component subunit alpha [Candidatus Dormibacteria bacterium]